MKNILLIMPYGSVGGMERLALTFYNYYKEQGFQVKALKLIKLETDIINFGEDELFLKPYDFFSMSRLERASFYLNAPRKIRGIVRDHNISESIAFGDMANLFSSLSFSKEFKIGSIHALKSVELTNKTFLNKIFKLAYRTSYRFLDRVVCISKAIKEDIVENCGYKFNNLTVIYNPHNVKGIKRLSQEAVDADEEIIFAKDSVVFLGRLSVQKSPWHLIKAFSLVIAERPETNLVIIGDGEKRIEKYVRKLVEKYDLEDKVFFLGRRSNPFKYIAAGKVLALSSHYEGTPNVIVESIAVGTPIVSSYCTKGIVELMSKGNHKESKENILVESGIITPNLFKGHLGLPVSADIIKEEKDLATALLAVLNNSEFTSNLKESSPKLLAKFDLKTIADTYINRSV